MRCSAKYSFYQPSVPSITEVLAAPAASDCPDSSCSQYPYAQAYRYWDYMTDSPKQFLEKCNPYYEKLLANQPEPAADAMDDRSRAIGYAKKHCEYY